MAVSSYNAIGSITLSSAQTTVTFSNIPQIYTDLVVVCSLVATSATLQNAPQLRINGDSRNNYSATALNGNGTNAASGRWSNQSVIYADYYGILQNDSIGIMTAHFMNYTSNTSYKTVLIRSGKVNKETTATSGLWRNTAAINSIQLITDSPNTFAAGTTFNLYGVGANQLKASGGDIIVSDGTYWYHAFKTSGTFTPNSTLSCDAIVIAGGGGGGGEIPGGGGAGGFRAATSLSISTATSVTVGAGGAGSLGSAGTDVGASGSNSVFSTITSAGGGGGGGASNNGAAGGSGGGGWIGGTANGGAGNTPSTSPVQGYAGGGGANQTYGIGGGGGGAGGAGANGGTTNGTSGKGGIGVNTYSTWATVTGTGVSGYYAGGGGGGTWNAGTDYTPPLGGAGGGGNGWGGTANPGIGGSGVPNTGGGGGGGGNSSSSIGGNGGSGLVIVRYAV